MKRLADVASEVTYFLGVASSLGAKLGPVLYQLPPTLKKDLGRLRGFLESLPSRPRPAFEFRHESWKGEDTETILAEGGAALCIADTDEEPIDEFPPPRPGATCACAGRPTPTTSCGAGWTASAPRPWEDAHVFFKHEDEAKGPLFAERLRALAGGV